MSLSCSFNDCRTPAYARWYRIAYFLNADEPVQTTFLACQDHDARLEPYDGDHERSGVFRIGLFADEVCWHQQPPFQGGGAA